MTALTALLNCSKCKRPRPRRGITWTESPKYILSLGRFRRLDPTEGYQCWTVTDLYWPLKVQVRHVLIHDDCKSDSKTSQSKIDSSLLSSQAIWNKVKWFWLMTVQQVASGTKSQFFTSLLHHWVLSNYRSQYIKIELLLWIRRRTFQNIPHAPSQPITVAEHCRWSATNTTDKKRKGMDKWHGCLRQWETDDSLQKKITSVTTAMSFMIIKIAFE